MKSVQQIAIQISAGELVDRMTILEIKAERLVDVLQVARVRRELESLTAVRDQTIGKSEELMAMCRELKAVNDALWQIEDSLRLCEQQQRFNAEFIELARSVYRNNDHRYRLKEEINRFVGSQAGEIKCYTPYE
jgi:hypothetical protein